MPTVATDGLKLPHTPSPAGFDNVSKRVQANDCIKMGNGDSARIGQGINGHYFLLRYILLLCMILVAVPPAYT